MLTHLRNIALFTFVTLVACARAEDVFTTSKASTYLSDLDLDKFKELIDKNPSWATLADPPGQGDPGSTLLKEAARADQPEIVKYLLSKGADPLVIFPSGQWFSRKSAFHEAAFKNSLGIVKIFMEAGVSVDDLGYGADGQMIDPISKEPLQSPHTALEWAAYGGAEATVLYLLERGAKIRDNTPKSLDNAPRTTPRDNAIHLALRTIGDSYHEKTKIHYGPRYFPNGGILPSKGYRVMIQSLLKAGADLKQPNWRGDTPLHIACEHAKADEIDFLFSEYAGEFDLNPRNRDGWTPLMCLAVSCPQQFQNEELRVRFIRVVQTMVKNGADLSLVTTKEHFNIQTPMTAYDLGLKLGRSKDVIELLKP